MSKDATPLQRIENLISQAHELRWTAYQQVIELAEEALDLARQINDTLWVVRSLNMIGWGYNRLGMPQITIKYAKESANLAKEHNYLREYGYALLNLSVCYGVAGDYPENLRIVEELIYLSETHQFYDLQAFAYNDLNFHYVNAGNISTGLDLLHKSIEIINTHNLETPKTFAYTNLARTYLFNNEIEKALENCKLALESAIQTNFVSGIVHALDMLSSLYLLLDDREKALDYAEKSYQTALDTGCDVNAPLCRKGIVYASLGQFDKMLEISERVHDELTTKDPILLSEFYNDVSNMYAAQEDYQSAFIYLQKSRDLFNSHLNIQANQRIEILKTNYQFETIQREAEFQQAQMLILQSEMEERLKRQRAEITLEKQRELMRSKNEILTRINHEFRTPVSILRMSFELLTRYQDRLTPESKEEHIRRIDEQFQHINNLLDDVLDALYINEQHNQKIIIAPINPEELAHSAITQAEKRTRTSDRVKLQINNLPPVIYHSGDYIEQIIVHLLTNAIKFSQDEVLLQIRTTDNQQLVIQVSDKGIGIPPDEQTMIFEVLTRGSNLNEIGGNGMGLALVKQAVDLFEGEIQLDSTLNIGTVITIILPLKDNPYSSNLENLT
jgi:signal transduction histidine kinase